MTDDRRGRPSVRSSLTRRDDGLYDPWLDQVPPPVQGASAETAMSDDPVSSILGWRGLEFIASVAWIALALHAFSKIVPDHASNLRLGIYSSALAISWVLRSRCREVSEQGWAHSSLRFLTPTILGIGFLAWASDLDLVARLKLSEPELRRCAAECSPRRPLRFVSWGRPAGSFRVASVVAEGHSKKLRIADEGEIDAGLLLCPVGVPEPSPGEGVDHLIGPWWRYQPIPDADLAPMPESDDLPEPSTL